MNSKAYIPHRIYDIRPEMVENLTGNSDTGGASNSVPQVDPVFSYAVKGGDIYVYLLRTEVAKVAIATFDNTSDEYAFAIQTLTSNSEYEAVELIRNAEKHFAYFRENPFTGLYDNPEAMKKLANILASFFDEGE